MRKLLIVLLLIVAIILSYFIFFENKFYQEAINKRIVTTFFDAAVNKKDFKLSSQYLGGKYIQHDPEAADGPEALNKFIQFLREKHPNAYTEIKQIYADGDYVILYVHSVREPGTRGRAIVDIFKLDNHKIVEHWEVVQAIPEKSANSHGMF